MTEAAVFAVVACIALAIAAFVVVEPRTRLLRR